MILIIREVFESKILPLLPNLNNYEIDREWIEILQESKNYPYDIQSSVSQTYRCNDLDTNLTRSGYNCHLLGAQIWFLIKNNIESRQVFIEQFRDMNTGRCAQGQSNRYLQVLNAFYKS